jgi:poly(A) polymerase/tRNA nucleotidyltransferase (CCA-adding enzyme)
MLSDLGILATICPELEECKYTPQEKAAADNVFQHSLATLDAAVDAKPPGDLGLRLAGLFHDIGKPETFSDGHFFGHEHVGASKARTILRRWKFDKETVDEVTHLIRHHMFWYQSEWTDSAVRRFIRNVGLESVEALYALRRADNIGSGARQPKMYALEALWRRIQEQIAAANAFSLHDLKIGGNDLKSELGMAPGPQMGRVLNALFERVTDEPTLNTRETLLQLAKTELDKAGEPE